MGTYKANRNNLEEVPEKTEKEKKQESTEKLVDLAGETALDVYTGGQFSNVKGMVEKVPVAGKVANKTWNKAVKGVSKIASKTPIGNIAKKADDAGITDTARSAKNMVNITKGNPGSSSDIASNTSKVNGTLNNINQKNDSSKSKGMLDFLDNSNREGLLGNLPKGLKIKLIVGCGAVFLFMLICIGVFASDDTKNLSLTDKSNMTLKGSSASSGELLSRLEFLANYFIENAGEYNQGAYLYVPELNQSIRKDCSGFAGAYMSYVSGVNLRESYTGEMVEINGSWAKAAMDAGWQAFTAEEIGDVSNLQPGDVLIEHTSGSKGHAEIYISPTETFGWGSKQSHYPLSKTIVNTSTGSKVRFGDGYHKEYRVIYRYMNATSDSNDANNDNELKTDINTNTESNNDEISNE